MRSVRRRFLLLLVPFLLSLFSFCLFPIGAFAMDAQHFDIPAQSLPKALKLFASQAKMQLIYASDDISDKKSNALVGEYDKHVALEQLLKDTGFEAVFTKGNGVTIRPMRGASKAEAALLSDELQDMQLAQVDSSESRRAPGSE